MMVHYDGNNHVHIRSRDANNSLRDGSEYHIGTGHHLTPAMVP